MTANLWYLLADVAEGLAALAALGVGYFAATLVRRSGWRFGL